MKPIQFFTLQSGPNPAAQNWLRHTFSELFSEIPEAVTAASPDALLDKLAVLLRRSNVFLIACELTQFLACKEQLLYALGYTSHAHAHILAMQQQPCPADADFPVGTTVFQGEGGRYNGFAMHCGKQELLFLPLDTALLTRQRPQIFDYLARRMQHLAKVSPLREDAQAVIVEALLQKMGNGAAVHKGPIVPESIVPLAEPEKKILPLTPLPLYEIDLIRARRMERAKAAAQLQKQLARLSRQEIRCSFLLSPVWEEIALLIGENCGNLRFQMELPAAADRVMSPEDALRLSEHHVGRHGGCCAVVTSPQGGKQGGHQAVIALSGPFENAQVRIAALEDRDPAACAPGLAAELLDLLEALLCPQEAQAEAVTAVNIRQVEVDPQATRGRTRAVTAACLAATTVIASVFFALYTPGASAKEEPTTAAYVEVMDYTVAENSLDLGSLTTQLLSAVPAAQNLGSFTELFSGSTDILRIFIEWLIDAGKQLIQQLPAATTTSPNVNNNTGSNSVAPASKGTYTFQVVGFGHGVGMSQEGAKVLASQGKTAEQIVKHYYGSSKIAIVTDGSAPSRVKHEGVYYGIDEYIARVTYGEIGRVGLVPDEALKAQMICAYTMAKRKNFSTTETDQHLLSASDWNLNFTKQFHAGMLSLAREVRGKYVTYDGAIANTLYFSSCGGYTASAAFAWDESTPAAYLTGGKTSPEALEYSTVSFTSDKIRELVSAYNKKYPSKQITLGSDVSQWIKILSTDRYGYVEYLQIGDRQLTGGTARLNFFTPANIKSHNFTMSFSAQ